jgi:hypothetical protein
MDSELVFESCGDKNSRGVETILFIHSFMNSKTEWISTVYYIKETGRPFHFLLPSIQLKQMSNADHCVDLLADLVRTEAKEGRTHVVGLSIGAHISIILAQRYPKLVTTLTISGYCRFSRIGQQLLPTGICLVSRIATRGTTNSPLSFSESRGIADILRSFPKEPLPIRTLIVVGMRPTALSKTSDNPKVAKALQRSLSSNQWKAVVKGGDSIGHRWNVDHPNDFAELILGWIDNLWSESLERKFKDI